MEGTPQPGKDEKQTTIPGMGGPPPPERWWILPLPGWGDEGQAPERDAATDIKGQAGG